MCLYLYVFKQTTKKNETQKVNSERKQKKGAKKREKKFRCKVICFDKTFHRFGVSPQQIDKNHRDYKFVYRISW